MKKFLWFSKGGDQDAVDDIALYPAENFIGADAAAGDAVSLALMFKSIKYASVDTTDALHDMVDITITADKHTQVVDAIHDAIEHGQEGIIVVADGSSSTFLTTDITACAGITFTA